jgi:hypothetical protein
MRKLLSRGAVVATVIALVAPVLGVAPARAVGTNTTVVLTFDHGYANQATAESLLTAHGMHGTFYVNSDRVGTPSALSWAQLAQFEADGNEIGSDTRDNVDLTTVPVDVARVQACQSRIDLMNHGLTITDFAYPFGHGFDTVAVRDVVKNCGYNSARRAWGLYSTDPACGTRGCSYPYAGLIPPPKPFAIQTTDAAKSTTTLADLQAYVTRAETHGGGLVPIIFDQICSGASCPPVSTPASTLSAFLDWLQPRAASTVVATMRDVVGGAVQPIDTTAPSTTVACNGSPCTGAWYNAHMLVTLTADDGAGSGVAVIRYTLDGSTPTALSAAYTGPFSLPGVRTLSYRAIDNFGNAETTQTQVINVDPSAPTSTIRCNGAACGRGYAAPVSVALSATDTGGSGVAAIYYTTNGSVPTASSTAYSTPFMVSSTEQVRFRGYDTAGNVEATRTQLVVIDTIAPTASISCSRHACGGRWWGGAMRVMLRGVDTGGSGIASIHYTTNGSVPTLASPLYRGPFGLPSTKTVKFRSFDWAGNASAVGSAFVKVDRVRPALSITAPTNGATVTGRVHVTIRPRDAQSGIATVVFLVDGHRVAVDRRAPYAYVWDTTKVAKGRHRLTVGAFDRVGNHVSKTITVTVR